MLNHRIYYRWTKVAIQLIGAVARLLQCFNNWPL